MQVGIGLTAAILPVAVAAATVRLDCRKAFLNIVNGVQRSGRVVSLKERCNWGEVEEERGLWMDGRRALSSGLGGFSGLPLNPVCRASATSEAALVRSRDTHPPQENIATLTYRSYARRVGAIRYKIFIIVLL